MTVPERFQMEFGREARLKWFHTLGPVMLSLDELIRMMDDHH